MSDTQPGDPEHIVDYWVHGPGGIKIRWGDKGDLDRCTLYLGKYFDDAENKCSDLQAKALPSPTGLVPNVPYGPR